MSRSQEAIDKIITDIQEGFEKAMDAKDFDGVMKFYHPEAVLVKTGSWGVHGHEAIKQKLIELSGSSNDEFKVIFDGNVETTDGSYIIHNGRFTFSNNPDKKMPYQQIFRRQPDGNYLIYHDEFSA